MPMPECPQCKRADRVVLDSVDNSGIEWWTCWRCQLDYSTLGQREYLEREELGDESESPL